MSYSAQTAQRRKDGRLPILIALCVAGLLFFLNRSGPFDNSLFRQTLEDGTTPALTYLARPFQGLEAALQTQRDRRRAFSENRALKEELRSLQDIRRERDALARKLEALETHMDVPPDAEFRQVMARLVAESGGPFRHTALLNVGTDQGLRNGAAVVSTQGLYGHVVRTGTRSARILQLTDSVSRIAVKSDRSGARAILAGDNSPEPLLNFIGNSESFSPGDRVLTSGDEGVFPEGLLVGHVSDTGRVELAETGRRADWMRVYVRETLDGPELQDRAIMRVVKVPVEPPAIAEPLEGEGEP